MSIALHYWSSCMHGTLPPTPFGRYLFKLHSTLGTSPGSAFPQLLFSYGQPENPLFSESQVSQAQLKGTGQLALAWPGALK